MDCIRKSDLVEPYTVHKCELSNLHFGGVRNVNVREEFTIVTGMGSCKSGLIWRTTEGVDSSIGMDNL